MIRRMNEEPGFVAAQLPDRIIFNLELFNLCTNPLESYWTVRGKKRPKLCAREDCRRGYIATWEIKGKHLFLIEIEGSIRKTFAFWGKPTKKFTLKSLFGRRKTLVKADWFSGKLRIPIGPMTLFVDNEYDSRFESEIIVTIVDGEVSRVVTLDNKNKTLIVNEGSHRLFD